MNKITNYCKNCDAWCCYDGVYLTDEDMQTITQAVENNKENQLTIVVIWVRSTQVLFHFYLVIDSRLTNLIKKLNSYRVKNKRTVIIDVIVN